MRNGQSNGESKTSRLGGWGSSLLNKLSDVARKRRKRLADKQRRQAQRKAIRDVTAE